MLALLGGPISCSLIGSVLHSPKPLQNTLGISQIRAALEKDPHIWTSKKDFLKEAVESGVDFSSGDKFANLVLFAYQSRSTQDASFDLPRVIFSIDRGRFIFTYSGHGEGVSNQSIEMAEYDPATKRRIFAGLRFDGERPQLDLDSSSCQKCHGSRPRLIWDTYPFWPGFYGSLHSGKAASVEQPAWERFAISAQGQGSPYYPLREIIASLGVSPGDSGEMEGFLGESNHLFGRVVAQSTLKRVLVDLKKIKQDKSFFLRGQSALVQAKPDSVRVLDGSGIFSYLVLRNSEEEEKSHLFPYTLSDESQHESMSGDFDERFSRLHEDKMLRMKIAGFPSFSRSYRGDKDYTTRHHTVSFLAAASRAGLEVHEWSNAVWYGPKAFDELQQIFQQNKGSDNKHEVTGSVFLFSDGYQAGESLGLRQNILR